MKRQERIEAEHPADEGASPDAESTAPLPEDAESAAGAPAIDYKDRWLRSEADLQNYRRRSQRDREEAVRFTEDRFALEMISQLDDLERALAAAGESGAPESWAEGVRLVANRMIEFLARQGVTPLDPTGSAFDPEFHEALLEVDPPDPDAAGKVVQVVRKGYARGGRALRPARVVVARAAAAGGA